MNINDIMYWHSKKEYFVVININKESKAVTLRSLSTGITERWHQHTVEKFSKFVNQSIELEEMENVKRPDMTDAEILRNGLEAFLTIIQGSNAGDKSN